MRFETSGTTGKPKAVDLSEEEISWRAARTTWSRGETFSRCRRIYVERSLSSTAGHRYSKWIAAHGGELVAPNGNLECCARLIASCDAAVLGPPSLKGFSDLFRDLRLTRIKVAVAGGSTLDHRFAEYALQFLCDELIHTYGASEVGAIAAGNYASHIRGIPGCVGFPLADITVGIADGEVEVTTPFKSKFRPGDKARWHNGMLVLEGRRRAGRQRSTLKESSSRAE